MQSIQDQKQKSSQPVEESCQEENPDQDGAGQSKTEESKSGHSGPTSALQNVRGLEEEKVEQTQKPGESDSKRSLGWKNSFSYFKSGKCYFSGDISEPVKKKLKTVDAQETKRDETQEAGFDEEDDAEMYQHIHEAKETSTQVQITLFTLNYVSYYDVYRFLMLQRKIKPTNRMKKKCQIARKKP